MNEEILASVLSSKKLRDIEPAAVKRICAQEETKYKKSADIEKSVRRRLHALTGAFFTPEEKKAAHAILEEPYSDETLEKLLLLHASTRERMPLERCRSMAGRIAEKTDGMGRVCDLACGINPVFLGSCGYDVTGFDIDLGAAALINKTAERWGFSVRAEGMDLAAQDPCGAYDTALFWKLLPILETERKGRGAELFFAIRAKYKVVTFPTRSLGGRNRGMAQNYANWFEENLLPRVRETDRFETENELVIITEMK